MAMETLQLSSAVGMLFNGVPDSIIDILTDNKSDKEAIKIAKVKKGDRTIDADKFHAMLKSKGDRGITR